MPSLMKFANKIKWSCQTKTKLNKEKQHIWFLKQNHQARKNNESNSQKNVREPKLKFKWLPSKKYERGKWLKRENK